MKKYDLILRNGKIVLGNGVFNKDIGIKDGRIISLEPSIPNGDSSEVEIDIRGMHVLPGLIDVHVHLNEPGRADWEGIYSGSRSLAAGGITTYFDMPLNSTPPVINPENFLLKMDMASKKAIIDFGIIGGVVPENIGCLIDLKNCGAVAFKGFMCDSGISDFSYLTDDKLYESMKKIAETDLVLMLHAESQSIVSTLTNKALEQGNTSAYDYEATRPIISEIEAVERAIKVAATSKCKLHIVHASSRQVINIVQEAKNRGVDITVETCPQYLSLTVEDIEKKGAIAKCSPPVHFDNDIEELWKSIKEGEVDIIASDHSPSPPEMKEMSNDKNIFNTWGGISSAQSTLNILLEEGYWKRGVSLETIARLMSTNPAKRFGLYPQKGEINIGSDADFTIVDVNSSYILQSEDLLYRHKISPFIGKKFRGKVIYTIVRGNIVFQKGQIANNHFKGKMVSNK